MVLARSDQPLPVALVGARSTGALVGDSEARCDHGVDVEGGVDGDDDASVEGGATVVAIDVAAVLSELGGVVVAMTGTVMKVVEREG